MTLSHLVRIYSANLFLLYLLTTATIYAQDGVCKKDKIPTDYVAVGEFNSPECDSGDNPFTKNAWRVEPVRDGITVCALPNYQVIGARVAELVRCEAVHSAQCNPRLDGLPNAFVLRSPTECVKRKHPDNFEVECSANAGLTNGSFGYMIAQLTSTTCPSARPPNHGGYIHTSNAWLSRKVDKRASTVLAVCADDFNLGLNAFIVRRFNNVYCPVNPYVADADKGLTGWIILQNPVVSQGKSLTVCAGFTKDSWKPFGEDYIAYHAPTKYSELCGGQINKPNSFEVTFGHDGVLFAEVESSCLVGTWREQKANSHLWSFNVIGDKLSIKRSDNFVTGSFSKSGINWIGQLKWGNGTTTNDVILSPTANCKEVRTNQSWWYRR